MHLWIGTRNKLFLCGVGVWCLFGCACVCFLRSQRHRFAKEVAVLINFPSCFFPLPLAEPEFHFFNFRVYLNIQIVLTARTVPHICIFLKGQCLLLPGNVVWLVAQSLPYRMLGSAKWFLIYTQVLLHTLLCWSCLLPSLSKINSQKTRRVLLSEAITVSAKGSTSIIYKAASMSPPKRPIPGFQTLGTVEILGLL